MSGLETINIFWKLLQFQPALSRCCSSLKETYCFQACLPASQSLPDVCSRAGRSLNFVFTQGSVLLTMWRAHYRRFALIGCIKLVDNLLVFASPLLLEQLLLCLQQGKSIGTPLQQLSWHTGGFWVRDMPNTHKSVMRWLHSSLTCKSGWRPFDELRKNTLFTFSLFSSCFSGTPSDVVSFSIQTDILSNHTEHKISCSISVVQRFDR